MFSFIKVKVKYFTFDTFEANCSCLESQNDSWMCNEFFAFVKSLSWENESSFIFLFATPGEKYFSLFWTSLSESTLFSKSLFDSILGFDILFTISACFLLSSDFSISNCFAFNFSCCCWCTLNFLILALISENSLLNLFSISSSVVLWDSISNSSFAKFWFVFIFSDFASSVNLLRVSNSSFSLSGSKSLLSLLAVYSFPFVS